MTLDRACLSAVLWCLCLQGGLACFLAPCWEDTDDCRMAMIASGIGSTSGPSERLVYTNVLVGELLKRLYASWPLVAWYGWYLLGVQAVAHGALAWVAASLRPDRIALTLAVLLDIALASYLWTHLQFTTTAALASTAGAAVLVVAWATRQPGWRSSTIELAGWALIVIGGLIRLQSCLLIGILIAPILIATAWHGEFRARVQRLCYAIVAICMLMGALHWDRASYRADPDWAEFRDLQREVALLVNRSDLRALLLNGSDSEVSSDVQPDLQHVLSDVGWTQNDLLAMFRWVYLDPEIYSPASVQQVRQQIAPPVWTSARRAGWSFAVTLATLVADNLFVLMCGAAAALLLSSRNRGWPIWIGWATCALCILVLWLVQMNLKLPPRVFNSAAVESCLVAWIASQPFLKTSGDTTNAASALMNRSRRRRWGQAGLAVAGLGAIWLTIQHVQFARAREIERFDVGSDVRQLALDSGRFYIVFVPFPFDRLSPLDALAELRDLKFEYLDGHQRSPRFQDTLRIRHADPVIEALIASPDMRLVTTKNSHRAMQHLRQFVREHRDQTLELATDRELTWCQTFRVTRSTP